MIKYDVRFILSMSAYSTSKRYMPEKCTNQQGEKCLENKYVRQII